MDVHRARFVPYPPSAINALAFSHSLGFKRQEGVRLAVGRANGDIEIWNPAKGGWVQETTFRGGVNRSIEGLAWIQEPDGDAEGQRVPGAYRLFSIGYSNTITEWDLGTGLPIGHSSGSNSEVWCVAAQPRWTEAGNHRQDLVVGCADGTVTVLSTEEQDLRFLRHFARPTKRNERVMSVTYQNRDTVIAGFSNSRIRVFDARNGTVIRNISLGSGPVGGPKDIIAWAVKCLPNGDIVSGDSLGDVRFYDGKTYSQTQRIYGHEADILDLAVGGNGHDVFTAGMDRKTVHYNRESGEKRWAKKSANTHHQHDVKALATCEVKGLDIVASGGIDANLVVLPLQQYDREYPRTVSGLPQYPNVTSAPGENLLAGWWDREVRIWRIQKQDKWVQSHRLIARIALKGEENISCVAISRDGTLLAVSSPAEVKLFNLRRQLIDGEEKYRIRKLEYPASLQNSGARSIQLSPNGKWLAIISHSNDVSLARITEDVQSKPSRRILPKLVPLSRLPRKPTPLKDPMYALDAYSRTITRAEFARDSNVLVVSDLAGFIDSWVLEGHEDSTAPEVETTSDNDSASSTSSSSDESEDDPEKHAVIFHGQHWARNPAAHLLPRMTSPPVVLTFKPPHVGKKAKRKSRAVVPNGNPAVHPTRHTPHPLAHDAPSGPYELVIITTQHQVLEVDVLEGRFTDWTRRNPQSALPEQFRGIRDRAMGACWHVNHKWSRLWVYGSNWVCMLDLEQDLLPSQGANDGAQVDGVDAGGSDNGDAQALVAGKKRKRECERGLPPEHMRHASSGAGSKRRKNEMDGPLSQNMTKSVRDGSGEVEFKRVKLDRRQEDLNGQGESDNDGLLGVDELAGLRDHADEQSGDKKSGGAREGYPKWWLTLKYRPILGMLPIAVSEDEDGTKRRKRKRDKNGREAKKGKKDRLEVCLVERPFWDQDLGPRYVGRNER